MPDYEKEKGWVHGRAKGKGIRGLASLAQTAWIGGVGSGDLPVSEKSSKDAALLQGNRKQRTMTAVEIIVGRACLRFLRNPGGV